MIRVLHCPSTRKRIRFMQTALLLSFLSLEFCSCWWWLLTWLAPVKKPLGAWYLMSFTGRQHFHVLPPLVAGAHPVCLSGRGLLEACTWFPPDLVPGSFADFTLHPTGISLSCQCSHMLSLVSPSSKSSNLELVLGLPTNRASPIQTGW